MKVSAKCLENGQGVSQSGHQAGDSCLNRPIRKHGQHGFTLVEVMIVVFTIILLAMIAIPNFGKARTSAQVRICITNLKRLDGSKQQWALENRKGANDIPTTTDISAYLSDNRIPRCPASGYYSLRRISRTPTCSRYTSGHTLNNLNMDEDAWPD